MDTYVIFCGGIEACIYCIMVEGVRDNYFIMVDGVKDVYTILLWRELGI